MYLDEYWQVFLIGCLGAVAAEALHWRLIFQKEPAKAPSYARNLLYWVATLVLIIFGGLLSSLQLTMPAPAIAALQIGVAGPLMLQKLSGLSTHRTRGNYSTIGRLLAFLAI